MKPAPETPRRDRLAAHLTYQQFMMKNASIAVLLALPLAILAAPVPWQLVGLVYAVAWCALVLPSTAVTCALAVDALLIFADRRPVFIPTALRAVELQKRHGLPVRRVVRWLRVAMMLSTWANPFGNLVMSLLSVAMQARKGMAKQLYKEAELIDTQELRVPEPVQVTAPTSQLQLLEQEVCPV